MAFYTSVARHGNNLLYSGYDDAGVRIREKIKFKPEMFVPSKDSDSPWKSLDGVPVEPINFNSMSDAKTFIESYHDVPEFKVYGMDRWIFQFIQRAFPGEIEFNKDWINITSLDIETFSGNGFEKPEDAREPITAITLKSSKSKVIHTWGTRDFDPALDPTPGYTVIYHQFDTEKEMLEDFVNFWSDPSNLPDIITGWNTRTYDIPYLLNRIAIVLSEDAARRLSPWHRIDKKTSQIMGKVMDTYEIVGVIQLDYLDLFQKFGFAYGKQESYKLGHIAFTVLGETKVNYDEYDSLHDFYERNHQKFIAYNIRDTLLVDKLEDKLGLISLIMMIAYSSGINLSDAFGTTAIWDSKIYRALYLKNIAIPPGQDQEGQQTFEGGYVKEPQIGLHEWVCSFDANSLYPSIMVQYNMSPETFIPEVFGENFTVDEILTSGIIRKPEGNCIVAANGACFTKEKQGIVPELIVTLQKQRSSAKSEMIKSEQILEKTKEGTPEYELLEKKIDTLNNKQNAVKVMLNALFGATANIYYRYFNLKTAEAITLTGQLSIRWAEKHVNALVNKHTKINKDRVIAIDTDSVYICLEDIIKKFNPEHPCPFLDEYCSKMLIPEITKSFVVLSKMMNCIEDRLAMKREVIASRGIWTKKKRYILNVLNKEGVQYEHPKLKIMGLEAVKTSTPMACRSAMKELFSVIMNKDEKAVQTAIADFRAKFNAMKPEEIAFPRGVSELKKYAFGEKIYRSTKNGGDATTPIHSRASLLYNHHLKKNGLDKKYQLIQGGDKMRFIYLTLPNPIRENVIGFIDELPKELNVIPYIDLDTQFQKAFLKSFEIVLDAIGWHAEEHGSLEEFFG
jgi:DNA polymerase elongation subunit (family B)